MLSSPQFDKTFFVLWVGEALIILIDGALLYQQLEFLIISQANRERSTLATKTWNKVLQINLNVLGLTKYSIVPLFNHL